MNQLINKKDYLLITVFIIVSCFIILKSYYASHGYLTSDSINYLALAQNFKVGNGLIDSEGNFFSKWPLGYPFLIYVLANISGLSVFWASKVLNIFFIGGILGFFRLLFRGDAPIYALIFFFSSFIEISTYTWTETFFIFALIFFTTTLYKVLENKENNFLIYFFIFLSSLLLFISRYIGAFSFGIIGILGICNFLKNNKTKGTILLTISLFNIVFMVGYLYNNFLETGFLTGYTRMPSSESNAELFLMLFKAIIAELAIPVHRFSVAGIIALGVEFSLLIFIISKYRKSIIKSLKLSKIPVLSSSFFIVGFTYLLSVIIFRWFIKFDQFAFRLLSPGTFMISVGLFFYIINICSSKGKKIFIYFLLFFSISSLILFVPVRTFIKHNKSNYTYNETKNKILKKYNNIEPNSIVVFGPYQLTYLRSDLKYYSPQYKESWSKFIGRLKIKNKKNIYVSIPKDIDSDFLDISTINFLKSHKSDKLIKL